MTPVGAQNIEVKLCDGCSFLYSLQLQETCTHLLGGMEEPAPQNLKTCVKLVWNFVFGLVEHCPDFASGSYEELGIIVEVPLH